MKDTIASTSNVVSTLSTDATAALHASSDSLALASSSSPPLPLSPVPASSSAYFSTSSPFSPSFSASSRFSASSSSSSCSSSSFLTSTSSSAPSPFSAGSSAFPPHTPPCSSGTLSSPFSINSHSLSSASASGCSRGGCVAAAAREAPSSSASPAKAATTTPAEKSEEHPLFMTSMPSSDAFKRNPLLAALAAIIEEDQLPFEAQRRRGRGEGRRTRRTGAELAGREEKIEEGAGKANRSFFSKQITEPSTIAGGAAAAAASAASRNWWGPPTLSAFEGQKVQDVMRKTTQTKSTGAGAAACGGGAADVAYRSYRNSGVPYAPQRRGGTGLRGEIKKSGGVDERAFEATKESPSRDAAPSIGELQICMKMWQMGS